MLELIGWILFTLAASWMFGGSIIFIHNKYILGQLSSPEMFVMTTMLTAYIIGIVKICSLVVSG